MWVIELGVRPVRWWIFRDPTIEHIADVVVSQTINLDDCSTGDTPMEAIALDEVSAVVARMHSSNGDKIVLMNEFGVEKWCMEINASRISTASTFKEKLDFVVAQNARQIEKTTNGFQVQNPDGSKRSFTVKKSTNVNGESMLVVE